MAAASATAGWVTAADSTSAGPSRLPAILIVSSERPWIYQKPSASTRAQSPWTHVPGSRDQYASRYRSRSRQKPRAIPGHGWRTTRSPTVPRTGEPPSSTTSASMPGTGPAKLVGFCGVITVLATMPPLTSVPPE